jgi:hypothetical protein
MTFATNMFKLFETVDSQVMRFAAANMPPAAAADYVRIEVECNKCKNKTKLQANFKKGVALEAGFAPFPAADSIPCSNCKTSLGLAEARRMVEAQSGRTIVF